MVEVGLNSDGQGEIVAHSRAALPPGVVEHGKVKNIESLGVALHAAFEAADPKPFSQRTVHFSLPDLVSYFHTFYFPGSLNKEEIANALAFQLEEVIPFDPDEMRGSHHVVERTDKRTIVTYAMALREDLAAYRQAFKAANLELGSLGLSTQALSRMIPVKDEDDPTAAMVVDVENAAAALCLFDQKGLRATFSQLFKKPASARTISGDIKEQIEHKEDIKVQVQKKPNLLRRSGLSKLQLNRLVYRIKEIISWFEKYNPETSVGSILLVGESEKRSELEQALIKAFQTRPTPLAIGAGNLFEAFVPSSVIDQALGQQQGALLAEACGSAVRAAVPLPRDFNLLPSSGQAGRSSVIPGVLSIFKRTQYDPGGLPISEMTVVRYRRRAVLVGTFFVMALAVLTTAITLRIRQDVAVSAHQEEIYQERAAAEAQIMVPAFEHVFTVAAPDQEGAIAGRLIIVDDFTNLVPVEPEQITYSQGRAAGSLEIRNASNQEVTLIANTRLLSSDGLLFRLDKEVTIAQNSSAEARVYADEEGAAGDLAPTTFSIPGLEAELRPLVTGLNRQSFSGGLVIESANQNALFASAEDLTTQYVTGRLKDILTVAEGEVLFPSWVKITPQSVRFTQNEAKQVVIEVKMAVQALVFSSENLADLVREVMAKKANLTVEEIDQPIDFEDPVHHSISPDLTAGQVLIKVRRYPQAPVAE